MLSMTNGIRGDDMATALKQKVSWAAEWFALVENFPLRPIRTDKEHTKAVAMATDLAVAPQITQDQDDYLTVLTGLIEDYESTRWPVGSNFTVPQIIESFMQDHDMTQSDLGRLLGERTMGHKILAGKRQLTVAQVKILARTFKVSPALFM